MYMFCATHTTLKHTVVHFFTECSLKNVAVPSGPHSKNSKAAITLETERLRLFLCYTNGNTIGINYTKTPHHD